MSGEAMQVQLIYCCDCPNVDAARENLRQAVASSGLAVRIEEFDTTKPGVPTHLRNYGSPTILVNDEDVAEPAGPTGPSCRLYSGPDRVPSVEAIRTALDRARSPQEETTPVATTDSSPVSCTLTPEQLDSRRDQLLPGLIERASEVTEVENGVRLRFENSVGLLAELAKVVEQERTCCSFLRFQLTAEPENGPIIFDVTGPPGTPELLRSLVTPQAEGKGRQGRPPLQS